MGQYIPNAEPRQAIQSQHFTALPERKVVTALPGAPPSARAFLEKPTTAGEAYALFLRHGTGEAGLIQTLAALEVSYRIWLRRTPLVAELDRQTRAQDPL